MKTFKDFLKFAFDHSGLYRAGFANKIGVSKPTLDNYLSGRTQPSFDEGCRIIKATGYHDVVITFGAFTHA